MTIKELQEILSAYDENSIVRFKSSSGIAYDFYVKKDEETPRIDEKDSTIFIRIE